MDKNSKQRGLGRGLSALMADVNQATPNKDEPAPVADVNIPVDLIFPNPDQPRRRFDDEQLADLSNSIREKGVIQPLIVRPHPTKSDCFEIVAGERRWRAAQKAKIHQVPVIIRKFDDTEVLEIAIIENIQRSDLNPIEEATGYVQLMEKFGHTQEQLSQALGKSRSHIANVMRLLQLPADVHSMVAEGKLSAGHARALITSENPGALAAKVIKKGLSVRQTEALAKSSREADVSKRDTSNRKSRDLEKDADTRALEADLGANLGMNVAIDHVAGGNSGRLVLSYKSLEQLDALCSLLSSGLPDESR